MSLVSKKLQSKLYMLGVYNISILLSPMDVEFILHLKAKGLKIDMNKYISNRTNLYNKYCNKKK